MKNMPSNIHFFLDRTTPTHPTHHHLVGCNSHHATEANQSVSSPNDGTFQAPERAEQCSQRHIEQSEAWQCPLWVKSGRRIRFASCPLYPKKRTFAGSHFDVGFGPIGDINNFNARLRLRRRGMRTLPGPLDFSPHEIAAKGSDSVRPVAALAPRAADGTWS
jgi:hypothetical protein